MRDLKVPRKKYLDLKQAPLRTIIIYVMNSRNEMVLNIMLIVGQKKQHGLVLDNLAQHIYMYM